MQTKLARLSVLAMALIAVVVQIGVWGATKLSADDGALLESWRPYFGWHYALAFAVAQAAVCRGLGIERGLVWLLRTWGITGGLLLLLGIVTGADRLTVDSGAALTAGMGAFVLAAGVYEGHLVPGAGRRAAVKS